MGIFDALPLMAEVKKTAHLNNHSLANFNVLGDDKYSANCKICKQEVMIDLSAELPVSGSLFIETCIKPERKKKVQISS
jgi:hypothetical protein